jgi:hypothetical protein
MRTQIELGRDDCNSAEPGDKYGVSQMAMTGRPSVIASPGPSCLSRWVGALTYSSNRASKWHSSGPRRRAQS